MTFAQLQAMVAIHEHGSFQAAAGQLGVSRATLRELIKSFEDELVTPLLVSSSSGATLTAAGREMIPRAERLLREFGLLEEHFRSQAHKRARTAHIQVSPGMPVLLHVAAMMETCRRHPDLHVLVETLSGTFAPWSEEVHLRLQFGAPPPKGPFRTFVVSRFPERLLATPSYLDEHGRPQTIEELKHHRLLAWISPGEDGCQWPLWGGGCFDVEPAIRSHDVGLIRQLATLHTGIALVPDSPMIPNRWGVELEVVLPDIVGRESMLRAVIPEALAEMSATRDLVAVTRMLVENAPDGLLTWEPEDLG